MIHCKAHQRGNADVIQGNRRADEAAKPVTLSAPCVLIPSREMQVESPRSKEKENKLAELLKHKSTVEGGRLPHTGNA